MKMDKLVYIDYNATTPIDPLVAEAMQPYLIGNFGNPSSSHYYGAKAREAIEIARGQVASLLGCEVDEIVFTSGGTESNNYAIKGYAFANREKGNHIITTSIEHPAVTEVCKYLEEKGFKVSILPVDEFGFVNPKDIRNTITPQTILISIMHANNEIGTIQPIEEISEIAHKKGIIVHSDCAQTVGKIPVNVNKLGVDLLSIAGHKFYAPKGVGALFVRTGVKLEKFVHGADHELNRRAGTENVLEIIGIGKACELVEKNLLKYAKNMKVTRNLLEKELRNTKFNIRFNGSKNKRLPNTLSISFGGIEANTIVSELKSLAVSAGAACHSDSIDISPTLEAMKVPRDFAMGTIRFSTGRYSTKEEINFAVKEITRVIEKLQLIEKPNFIDTKDDEIKLTQFTHGLGCACKLRPQLLEEILKSMPSPKDDRILVGLNSSDDAAVYRLDSKTSIVQTVDFFTPVVDDPFQFGAIAAANSLSDIYAMGGKPLFALNVVGFPSNRLPIEVLERILKGANLKAKEAGISIIGGHTVDDTEPKYGLAVTGIIESKKIVKNSNAKNGDILILTKAIGTGIYSTALKKGILIRNDEKLLIKTMAELNKSAAEVMRKIGVNACTDITGFGLLGHLLEMMNASNTRAIIEFNQIKFLPRVLKLAVAGNIPGGTKDNLAYTKPFVNYSENISDIKKYLLNDAQTSGGLLISVSKNKSKQLLDLLKKKGIKSSVKIGEVTTSKKSKIEVI
jgi:cysteine desulfurase NifS/selenium donor protein